MFQLKLFGGSGCNGVPVHQPVRVEWEQEAGRALTQDNHALVPVQLQSDV